MLESGFIRLGKIGEMLVNGLPDNEAINKSGIYAITKPQGYKPDVIEGEELLVNKNVISAWGKDRLKAKWVADVDIVYFGIAGAKSPRSLKKRLDDFIYHGNGFTTDRGPHKGGEIFWQLRGYEEFELWILPKENPRELENQLLISFFKKTGKLPFANRQF